MRWIGVVLLVAGCSGGVELPESGIGAVSETHELRGTLVPGAGTSQGGTYQLRGAISPGVRPIISEGGSFRLVHAPIVLQ